MKIRNKSLWAEFGLLLVALMWGSNFIFLKNIVDVVPAQFLNAIRFLIAGVVLAAILNVKLKKLDWQCIKAGIIKGVIMFVAFSFQTNALRFTTVGKNSFITAVYVVIVPFLYWIIKKRKPNTYHVVAAVMCVAGIGLLSLNESFSINLGDALSLAGGFVFALHIVIISIFTEKTDPVLMSVVQFLTTGILALAAAFLTEPLPQAITLDVGLSLLYIGIIGTMLSLVMQCVCTKYTTAAKSALILSLESVFGTLLSIWILHEAVGWQSILGFVIIFAAIVLAQTELKFLRPKTQESSAGQTAQCEDCGECDYE